MTENLTPVILIRDSLCAEPAQELAAIQASGIPYAQYRTHVPRNSLVVGRYSVLPYYDELEADLAYGGSRLVHSYAVHQWIANMGYADDLGDLTPAVYLHSDLPHLPEDAYVVKGVTNSRKDQWNTHMYAASLTDLRKVLSRCYDDSFLRDQGLRIRPFVPLRKFTEGINGMPVTNEWRVFCYRKQILASGYYWASAVEEEDGERLLVGAESFPNRLPHGAESTVYAALERIRDPENASAFLVVDVAQTEAGHWIVIEMNDGQMSGLSMVDPEALYKALRIVLTRP